MENPMRSMLTLLIFLTLATPALASDGVLEINQVCAVQTGCFAGDTAGFPVTIANPGSYRLTGNIATIFAGPAVEINAARVSLDLNGFTLESTFGASAAISSTQESVTVMNGMIIGQMFLMGSYSTASDIHLETVLYTYAVKMGKACSFTDSSVSPHDGSVTASGIQGGASCSVTRSRFSGSTCVAHIGVGENSLIQNNVVLMPTGSDCIQFPIVAGAGSSIIGNVTKGGSGGISSSNASVTDNVVSDTLIAFGQYGGGIYCSNCMVRGNVVRNSQGFGLVDFSGTSGYSNNHFTGNNGGNLNPQVSGGIDLGGNVCGGDMTCP